MERSPFFREDSAGFVSTREGGGSRAPTGVPMTRGSRPSLSSGSKVNTSDYMGRSNTNQPDTNLQAKFDEAGTELSEREEGEGTESDDHGRGSLAPPAARNSWSLRRIFLWFVVGAMAAAQGRGWVTEQHIRALPNLIPRR